MNSFRGFIVHGFADLRRDRLYYTGRLEDGRSFGIMESRWRPFLHIYKADLNRAVGLLSSLSFQVQDAELAAFSGREDLALLVFSRYAGRSSAAKILEEAGIPSPDGDQKVQEAFLSERGIRLSLEISGPWREGRRVDLVFSNPEIRAWDSAALAGKTKLKIASIDIETDTTDNSIRAVGTAVTGSDFGDTQVTVRVLGNRAASHGESRALESQEPCEEKTPSGLRLIIHPDEKSLLLAFLEDIGAADPDVLTGWNFLDFDFPRLAARYERYNIPFSLGRSDDGAKFFPGEGRRSAAALVPGRQVLDALRIVRAGPKRFPDYTLETVSREVLGEGKSVASTGEDKIAELDRLYAADPGAFGEYCARDAELVVKILARMGLFRLTMERSELTGVFLDKAWTSVVSFERIYGLELRGRGIAPEPSLPGRRVSGAAGGTVLDPRSGLFSNVGVFDFRSLYPTIMRTFNIDPLAHERSASFPDASRITAPNGAAFVREPGLLPGIIAGYFESRRKALDAGNETAAYVYKILMNSFYGVLGTGACRYGRTELAGAITSFARKWLLLSRDWFTEKGFPVLYGDTDSLFVATGLNDESDYAAFQDLSGKLAAELNVFLKNRIREEYDLESFLELRFEKAYRRFLIPPLRSFSEGESRGRAKGYGGYVLDEGGGLSVEVKGMEAVRSDATTLARRLQVELLELVFSGLGEEAFTLKVMDTLKQLRAGKLDNELVYRKRLSRFPESYTASTPPQVKAARALGWKGRRGTVEFVWTVSGPAPASLPHDALDYDHYAGSQVLPLVKSIAAAALWDTEIFSEKGRSRRDHEDGQIEMSF